MREIQKKGVWSILCENFGFMFLTIKYLTSIKFKIYTLKSAF